MSTKIIRSTNAKYGIALEVDGVVTPITRLSTDNYYCLPENPVAKYIVKDLVDFHLSDKDEVELTKETASCRTYGIKNSYQKPKYPSSGASGSSTTKVTLEKVLEWVDDDTKQKIHEAIVAHEADMKRQKLEAEIAALTAKLAELQGNN